MRCEEGMVGKLNGRGMSMGGERRGSMSTESWSDMGRFGDRR